MLSIDFPPFDGLAQFQEDICKCRRHAPCPCLRGNEFERITTRVLTPLYIGLRGPLAVLIVLPYFSPQHTP